MTQMDANIRTRRVASIIKRSCGDDFAFDSVRVIQVKDLFSSLVSLKCSSPGQNCFISGIGKDIHNMDHYKMITQASPAICQ